jgi:hypothetical protein
VTPAEEARIALDLGVSRSDLSPAAQIEYDKLAAARAPEAGTSAPQEAASAGTGEAGQVVPGPQPAKEPPNAAEGPAGNSRQRRRLRRTAVLSALGTAVVLPLALWGIETYGPTGVDALRDAGNTPAGATTPVTVAILGESTGQGAEYVFPQGRLLTPGPAAGCINFLRWADENGGYLETGSDSFLVIVQGRTAQQAVITSIQPRILSREPVPNGAVIESCAFGKGSLPTVDLNFDLSNLAPAFKGAYSVSSTDSDVFNIAASSQRYAYKWVIEMQVVQNGHVFTIDIRAPDGQPFTTTPETSAPAQYFVYNNGSWAPGRPSRT